MITEYLRNCKNLTPTEEILRQTILENPEVILNLSIKELANTCHVGMASVNRLCAKLGYSGYSEFKVAYIKDYKDLVRSENLNRSVPFNENTTIDEVIEQIPIIYEIAVGFTKAALNRQTIIRCVERMSHSKILVFGNGLNHSLAEIFSYKLEELGMDARAFDAVHYQYVDTLINRGQSLFAIVMSHSGRNANMSLAVRALKKRGVFVLLLCHTCPDSLREFCNEVISIIPTKNTKELSSVNYMMANQYVLDVLYTLLLVKNLKMVENVGNSSGYYTIGEKIDEL